MTTLVNNTFSTYLFTPEEEKAAYSLSYLNICNIQNLIAEYAERKLSIAYDHEKPLLFAQQEAHMRGCIEALQHLVSIHESAQIQDPVQQSFIQS